MSAAEKIVDRLRTLGYVVPDGWTFHRTHAGRVQRQAGAWSWWIERADGREIAAGFVPASEVAVAWKWEIGPAGDGPALVIDPVEGPRRCAFSIPLDSRGRRTNRGDRAWSRRPCKQYALPGEPRCALHQNDDGR